MIATTPIEIQQQVPLRNPLEKAFSNLAANVLEKYRALPNPDGRISTGFTDAVVEGIRSGKTLITSYKDATKGRTSEIYNKPLPTQLAIGLTEVTAGFITTAIPLLAKYAPMPWESWG